MKNNRVKNEPWLSLAIANDWQIQVDEIVLNIVDDEGTPIIDQNGEKMRFYPLRELEIVDWLLSERLLIPCILPINLCVN
mgnify:CR=1 FL=1